ncbi:NAD(P)H-dependent D-xylose reductase (XR) [Aspergillus wentii]|nr:NAD(P)H-dependent D-xylose reductase (XR) [Aspergillus wentii]
MEALVNAGLARSIGVGNFNIQLLRDLLCVTQTVTRVRPGQGIAITAYCSFRPTSSVAGKSTAATKYTSLLQHGLIQELQSTSQVLLRWVTQRGIAIISKSRDEERMRLNLDGEWKLRDEEIERISSLDAGVRFNDPVDHGFDVPVFE